MLELKVSEGPLDRQLFTLNVSVSSEILPNLSDVAPHFAVFLAWDAAGVTADEISDLARQLHGRGLAYLCAFGPDCERVHDLFDQVELDMLDSRPAGSVIMTTWHDDEPLEDALWFFVYGSFPHDAYETTCRTGIAVTIGNADWATQVAELLSRWSESNAEADE